MPSTLGILVGVQVFKFQIELFKFDFKEISQTRIAAQKVKSSI